MTTGRHRSYLALGSNLGDRWSHLRDAARALPDVAALSDVYETDAVGGSDQQGPYLNMVVALETALSPRDLLALARHLETQAVRVRRERWGPRTLDVDILRVGDLVVDDPDFVVPHPRMHERWFVRVPLADVAPELGELADRNRFPSPANMGVYNAGPLFPIESLPTIDSLRARLDDARGNGVRVGLVPTMGALHDGHASLVRAAVEHGCGLVVTSVFVNPLQFGPSEDLAAYPRTLEQDTALAARAGTNVIFAPTLEEMYPFGPDHVFTNVVLRTITNTLEGAHRPGHFDGVATVVCKLLNITGPCYAFFGEKDFQQLAVVRRMTADLSIPVHVVGCPIVREPHGLAMSSRNRYLSPDERERAGVLYRALGVGAACVEGGERDPAAVRAAMAEVLATEPAVEVQYAEVVNPDDFRVPEELDGEVRLLVAARVGRARLIDNVGARCPHP